MVKPGGNPRLVIFDVDGTISDSQGSILAAMASAFSDEGLTLPSREAILGIVGLSLDVAMLRLVPEADPQARANLVAAYKQAYFRLRATGGPDHAPLYPGMSELIRDLAAQPDTLVGVATGKSRRGAEALLQSHGLRDAVVTVQTADDHPSKPHPSMLITALAETGVDQRCAVMVGDTTYDVDMAQAAGIAAIAVGWGYHPAEHLHAAQGYAGDAMTLRAEIDRLTKGAA